MLIGLEVDGRKDGKSMTMTANYNDEDALSRIKMGVNVDIKRSDGKERKKTLSSSFFPARNPRVLSTAVLSRQPPCEAGMASPSLPSLSFFSRGLEKFQIGI